MTWRGLLTSWTALSWTVAASSWWRRRAGGLDPDLGQDDHDHGPGAGAGRGGAETPDPDPRPMFRTGSGGGSPAGPGPGHRDSCGYVQHEHGYIYYILCIITDCL